jgi:hypothetical protein
MRRALANQAARLGLEGPGSALNVLEGRGSGRVAWGARGFSEHVWVEGTLLLLPNDAAQTADRVDELYGSQAFRIEDRSKLLYLDRLRVSSICRCVTEHKAVNKRVG